MKKVLLIICGSIAFTLGCVGIVLPILPTTPFLLLASFCFVRASDRLYTWLCQTKVYTNHLAPFIVKRGMTLVVKLSILIPVICILLTIILLSNSIAVHIVLTILIIAKISFFVFIPTLHPDNTPDQ